MAEAYDLTRMLEEIIEDERVSTAKNRKISQEEIKRMLPSRQRFTAQARRYSKIPLGEILVEEGLITAQQLQNGLEVQAQKGGRLGSILVGLGYISDEQVLKYLGRQYGTQWMNLLSIDVDENVLNLVPLRIMMKHRILPLKVEGRSIHVAMETPGDFTAIHEVEFLTGRRVKPVVVPSYQMDLAIKYIEEKGGHLFSGSDVQHTLKGAVTIQSLIEQLVASKGSDILINAGVSPFLKMNNTLKRSDLPPLSPDDCVAYAKALMSQRQWEDFLKKKELDFSLELDGLGRFKVNAYRQRNTISFTIRRIMDSTLSFDELGIPRWLEDFALKHQGLILIASPAGHGKTTTLAAMIDLMNRKRKCNIIALEDPIEYIHEPLNSNINQREIGTDTDSFSEGLKGIFRQAPDVIVLGDMPDHETCDIALRAALSGHLVVSAVHATNAASAVESVVARFPHYDQARARESIAEALLLVFSQRLVPGRGDLMVLAYEKLLNSHRIRNFICENTLQQVRSQTQVESDDFSSIDVSLVKLVKGRSVDLENAFLFADSTEYLLKMSN